MARSRHRLTKAITLKTIKPTLAWAQGAAYAFDFPANAARFTDRPAGNLLTFPEAFDNAAWSLERATVSANYAAAPDGTTTADRLVEDATAANTHDIYRYITIATATTYTLSLYVKGDGRTALRLLLGDTGGNNAARADFNLTTGAVHSSGTNGTGWTLIGSGIEALANSWYRVWVTGTSAASTSGIIIVYMENPAGTILYNGDGASALQLWGARLEAGSVAADYLTREARYYALASVPGWTFSRASTGYALNNAGQLVAFASGAPRITDRGFLAEGSRQNLCLQSQTFNNASWSKNQCSISADAVSAPDGTQTADKIVEDTSASVHDAIQSFTKAASATQYATSFYLKAGERTFARLGIDAGGSANQVFAIFNLSNGTVHTAATAAGTFTAGTATITALSNGWYRCEIIGTTGTETTVRVRLMLADATATISYTGDGTSGIYVWGAQLEAASFPSSYIPTTTAAVTRAADSLTITGVTGLDYPMGVFAEWERNHTDASTFFPCVTIDTGSSNDSVQIVHRHSTLINRVTQTAGGVSQADVALAAAPLNQINRTVARFALNDVNGAVNGTVATADTSATAPAAPSRIVFGTNSAISTFWFGYIRRIAIPTRALTNAELASWSYP